MDIRKRTRGDAVGLRVNRTDSPTATKCSGGLRLGAFPRGAGQAVEEGGEQQGTVQWWLIPA